MAYQKTFVTPEGFTVDYWRIGECEVHFPYKQGETYMAQAKLYGFVNKALRDSDNPPTRYTRHVSFPLDIPAMQAAPDLRQWLYAEVKKYVDHTQSSEDQTPWFDDAVTID